MTIHKTVPVQVWVDVDEDIVDDVRFLNSIPGVRTFASCQGTDSYPPQVMTWWPPEAEREIMAHFNIGDRGDGWAYLHPLDRKSE